MNSNNSDLEQKMWWRLLKVLYVVIYVIGAVYASAIGYIISSETGYGAIIGLVVNGLIMGRLRLVVLYILGIKRKGHWLY